MFVISVEQSHDPSLQATKQAGDRVVLMATSTNARGMFHDCDKAPTAPAASAVPAGLRSGRRLSPKDKRAQRVRPLLPGHGGAGFVS